MKNIFKYGLHFGFKKLIYVSITNSFKTMNKLKGIFKPLRCFFKLGFGEWNYSPVLWCSRPSIIQVVIRDVMWKDKYDSPRYENVPPYIWIHLYKINFIWYWDLYPHQIMDTSDYWEQALWYLYYTPEHTIEKARETWPWKDTYEYKSTWNNKFLVK